MSILVFLGGLGDVAGGARIVDIPKENLDFGPGTASFSAPHSLFSVEIRWKYSDFRWKLGGNIVF